MTTEEIKPSSQQLSVSSILLDEPEGLKLVKTAFSGASYSVEAELSGADLVCGGSEDGRATIANGLVGSYCDIRGHVIL
ncbi:unnamed protein product [Cochlearia groenlandica]